MIFSGKAKGKLLLSGEYFVTEGAVALAVPTRLGQSLEVVETEAEGELHWLSYEPEEQCWFEGRFSLVDFDVLETSEHDDAQKIARQLRDLLEAARRLNPSFLLDGSGLEVRTNLDFPRHWGLGSSSTLVSLLAQWAGVDAFGLLALTFGGSGYDLVAAQASGPYLFQKFNGRNRWEQARFAPDYLDKLYFVHLNRKQDTRLALVHYSVTPPEERLLPLPRISQISHNLNAYARSLADFEALLEEHEVLVKSVVRQPRAKDLYFSDYWAEVKSLGAWGGDFVLVTSERSEEETRAYFASKGFETFFSYQDLVG